MHPCSAARPAEGGGALTTPDDARWVPGTHSGLLVPGDAEALLEGGPDFLTRAFRTSGALPDDASVSRIVGTQPVDKGGTGAKLQLTVAYGGAPADLPEELFVKFSRNFGDPLRDSARHQAVSEVQFAVLSGAPGFPVPVPRTLFADIDPQTQTSLIVSASVPYGRDGVEPLYPKCLDHLVPDAVGHYEAILRGLARLAGAHRSGRLPAGFDHDFADAVQPAAFLAALPLAKVLQRAERLFAFVDRCPQLFPDAVRTAEFRAGFLADVPDVIAASDRIQEVLQGDPSLVAFSHWNANIDNCWFTRDEHGALLCGFLDWANAGRLSAAQSVTGALSGAETSLWETSLDHLLGVYVEELAAHGGPQLDVAALRQQVLLLAASSLPWSMGSPIAVPREVDDVEALTGPHDPRLALHDNARIQLHMSVRLLHLWHVRRLGDLVRAL